MSATTTNFLSLTDKAKQHFIKIIEAEGQADLNLRLEVLEPLTSRAEISLSYCPKNKQEPDDIMLDFVDFKLFVASNSKEALNDAKIDYDSNDTGGELVFKAPNIYGKKLDENLPLIEQVNYIVESEVNPFLANHGGSVEVAGVNEKEGVLELSFSGGCQGCSMSKITLKNYIEKIIFRRFPQIKAIEDVTDHTNRENSYA